MSVKAVYFLSTLEPNLQFPDERWRPTSWLGSTHSKNTAISRLAIQGTAEEGKSLTKRRAEESPSGPPALVNVAKVEQEAHRGQTPPPPTSADQMCLLFFDSSLVPPRISDKLRQASC